MKIISKILGVTLLVLVSSCRGPQISIDPINEDENIVIFVPDTLIVEVSENDLEQTGVACGSQKSTFSGELIEITEIPENLPENHDLSPLMPPVRSQGNQGSCVAWATTYYLKSYQEKIQYGYEYTTYENIMSPSFVYNQIKVNPNCGAGSAIGDALDLLATTGCNNWKEFPYSDLSCSNLPTDHQIELAGQNKIKDYYNVGIPEDNVDENYTKVNLIKTLIHQGNPIVIAMDFENLEFEDIDNLYIANSYTENPIDSCGHAILIVGYDNQINAFKIINSWGSNWGNDGYAWINYNFFLKNDEMDFEEGFQSAYIAYDAD